MNCSDGQACSVLLRLLEKKVFFIVYGDLVFVVFKGSINFCFLFS